MLKAKRVEEIDDIQDRLRKLSEEYKSDFAETPTALDAVVHRDLKAAIDSLELLSGHYKAKTDKKAK